MSENFLFVYGTLKRGFCNHYFLSGSKFVGKGVTKEKYALYLKGEIPYVIKKPPVSKIKGEVYLVDSETLKNIDELEGHPFCYFRELTDIQLKTGEEIKAWMYFFPENPEPGILIPEGEYTFKLLKN